MKDTIYYYTYDCYSRPIITVCLKQNGAGGWARGVAVCRAELDVPSKKIGRHVAHGRAAKAIETKSNKVHMLELSGFAFQYTYEARLSEYEKELLERVELGKEEVQPFKADNVPNLST